ncbi:MAG: substrate-binding domain-containing protein [Treponema sp.]|jgi:ribose transport system substrate-binding protein|nr:substrate-binding domain-containing protein [Treponema sp.]
MEKGQKRILLAAVLVLSAAVVVFAGGKSDTAASSGSKAITQIKLPSGAVMSTGPHGEVATSAADIALTDAEIDKIRAGKYKVAICFHYNGDDWSAAQEKGLRDTFGSLGITVLAVTSANFNAAQQKSDIENVLTMKPDAIVSIPVDVVSAESVFKEAAAKGVKLVFMDNCPDNMTAGVDYTAVVSADNYGNGVAAAEIMGEQLGGTGKIAMVYYDANFFVTNQRDNAFRKTLQDKYPGITIVEESGFADVQKGETVGSALLTKYNDLNGIYATWDIPAEGVVSAIRAAGRNDVIVTTIDLGNNVARLLAEDGIVKGLGAQRPYDQGVAEALLVGYALLGKKAPGYVALPPLKVTHENVLNAYQEIYHTEAPADIQRAYKK